MKNNMTHEFYSIHESELKSLALFILVTLFIISCLFGFYNLGKIEAIEELCQKQHYDFCVKRNNQQL